MATDCFAKSRSARSAFNARATKSLHRVRRFAPKWQVWVKGYGLYSPAARSVEQLVDLLPACDPQPTATDTCKRLLPLAELQAASGLSSREAKKVDRFSLLAVAAARAALHGAGLRPDEIARCGIVTGNMMAGWTFTETQLRALHAIGPGEVSPYLATAWFPAAPQGQITIHLKMMGFAKTVTTDRCAGTQAIGLAFDRIRNRRSDLLLAGGVEAPVTPFVEAAFTQLRQGQPQEIAEAAAYLLLSAGKGDYPAIGAYETFSLPHSGSFSAEAIAKRIARFVSELPDHLTLSIVVCNVAADSTIEEKVASVITEALPSIKPRLFFPVRAIGDCLAASGAIATLIAHAVLVREQLPCSALVLSIGEQCGDLLWMYR
jgi:3-oxoacyl-[acyl-carrier-protein] synthase II